MPFTNETPYHELRSKAHLREGAGESSKIAQLLPLLQPLLDPIQVVRRYVERKSLSTDDGYLEMQSTRSSIWQFSLQSLMLTITTLAICLGNSTWLIGGVTHKGLLIDIWSSAIALLIGLTFIAFSYRRASAHAGPKLFELRREPNRTTWILQLASVAFTPPVTFLVLKHCLPIPEPGPNVVSLIPLWMFMSCYLIDFCTGYKISFHKDGIVSYLGVSWHFIPWRKCQTLTWASNKHTTLSFGLRGPMGNIELPSADRDKIEELLTQKLQRELH